MKQKGLIDLENQDYEEETDSETEALQEAFAKGVLKPGLNKPLTEKKYTNNIVALNEKMIELQNNLDWVERLDLISKKAPMPPELALQMAEAEKQNNNFAYDELKHESLFYRQAQDAVLESIPKLKDLAIPIRRPDDYYAQMAKSDEHMQKIKAELIKKKTVMERVEKVRQIRAQKKLQKALQAQSKVAKQEAKKEFNNEVKKFRKGQRKDLGFLEGKDGSKPKAKKSLLKRHYKDTKFGFGGKKRGRKLNTRDSTNDITSQNDPTKKKSNNRPKFPKGKGKGGKKSKQLRPGKNKRKHMKSKK